MVYTFDTAVGLTKFLHDKKAKREELLQVAADVVYGRSPVMLPQKHSVILDWLLERMSGSGDWKVDAQCWVLVKESWESIDDAASKSRIYSKHDMVTLISSTLKELKSAEILSPLGEAIEVMSLDVLWVKPPGETGYQLVSNFLGLIHTKGSYEQFSKQLSPVLKPLIDSSIPKKQLNYYASNLFIPTLIVVGSQPLLYTSEWLTGRILEETVAAELDVVDLASKAIAQDPAAAFALPLLFRVVSRSKDKKHAAACFDKLVELSPRTTFELLRVAVDNNVTLENDVLKQLIDRLLAGAINWQLLHMVLSLNSDVVFQATDRIFPIVDGSLECVAFLKALVQAYAAYRDFPNFFTKWGDLEHQVWQEPELVDEVVAQVKELSTAQLKQILNDITVSFNSKWDSNKIKQDNHSVNAKVMPAIAVVKSLFSRPNAVVEQLQDQLLELLQTSQQLEDPRVWEMKYLVLSLNSDFVQKADMIPSQVASVSRLKDKDHWVALLQVVFRLQEFHSVGLFEQLVTQFLDFISSNPDDASYCLSMITSRWLILANAYFGDQHLTLLSQLYIQNPTEVLKLVKNPLFYEQSEFVNEMVHQFARELEQDTDQDVIITALEHFPIEVFTQYMRQRLLDLLLGRFKQSGKVIQLLTTFPTYSSKVETDVDLLVNIVSKMPTTDYFGILANIVRNHVTNIADPDSSKFITKLLKKMLKLIKDPEEWLLQFSTVVVHQINDDELLGDAASNVLQGFTQMLESNPTSQTLKSLEQLIPHVRNERQIGRLANSLAKRLKDSGDQRGQYFKVMCMSYDIDTESVAFITSQFLQFDAEGFDVSNAYKQFMMRAQDRSVLAQLCAECSKGTSPINSSLVEAIRINLSLLTKGEEEAFGHARSLFTTRYKQLDARGLLSVLSSMNYALKEQPYLITQYTLEEIIVFVDELLSSSGPDCEFNSEQRHEVYNLCTAVMSSVVLFHRHRLNGRYYLFMNVLQGLLHGLALPRPKNNGRACWINGDNTSASCAIAFARLISNVCEPPVQPVKKNELNSSASLIKKEIAKHVYVVLHAYVQLTLQAGFRPEIKEQLRSAMYPLLDVMTEDRLKIANNLMDPSGRFLFKSMYEDYQRHGKWRSE